MEYVKFIIPVSNEAAGIIQATNKVAWQNLVYVCVYMCVCMYMCVCVYVYVCV